MLRLRRLILALVVILLALLPMHAWAWSHQGHILITRLACLRIIQDPTAPQGLKDFLQAHMKADLTACENMATGEIVGAEPDQYLTGFDGVATLPDRIQGMPAGKKEIVPYGAPENKMHFLDLEVFCADPVYKVLPDQIIPQVPELKDISRNPADPRYKIGGYVVFRVPEQYARLVKAMGPGDKVADAAVALNAAGFLAHYLEDCHQPHHSTIDFKSLSYLAEKVKGVHTVKTIQADGTESISYKSDSRAIDPHGAIEHQLFENAEEPRKSFRREFWTKLQANLTLLDAGKIALIPTPAPGAWTAPAEVSAPTTQPATAVATTQPVPSFASGKGFEYAYEILRQGHQYLPLVGHASIPAFANQTFDPAAYFAFKEKTSGAAGVDVKEETMSMVDLIALQNARAVLAVEKTLRAAWSEAHGAK
ncbi:MAG: hypothetical protein WCJ97_07575 [Phycisphaerae bacterium]